MSSTPAEFDASERLFFDAMSQPADQRFEYVSQNCGANDSLRNEVLLLLKNADRDTSEKFILDKQPSNLNVEDSAALGENVGDCIGPFRLLERIGEGGMGVVYMAEQNDRLRRKVALKIVKLGMDTRQVVARFEAERQAMALFDHPGIARVLDAGATDNGRPYFVMELVRGSSITKFSADKKLSLHQRIQLFVDVCKAVQHAHQKGIIHRDLKPSNILVTMIDGKPVPKIIDFGVVKAVGQRLTEKTLFTRYAAMIGTPQYMSPEQAELSGSDVDTRSDIYSLGVVLYELITGTTPIDSKKINSMNPLALYETIRDAKFQTPSIRITTIERDFQSSKVDSGTRLERPRSELDWIVMKTISVDRNQRYETASELAAELVRYIDGDPVLAAPPSKVYLLNSYFRKHRAFITSVAATSLLLIVATIVSTVFALNSRTMNVKLTNALIQAEQNLERAESAEKELLNEKIKQDYEAAHSIVFAKFMRLYSQKSIQIFMKDPPNKIENTEFIPETGVYMGFDISSAISSVQICEPLFICPDHYILTNFKSFEDLELPTQRLNKFLRDEDCQCSECQSFVVESSTGFDISIDSPMNVQLLECREGIQAMEDLMTTLKPDFYRMLVDEYRKIFGENDDKVADALTLLAASLIEQDRQPEAEAWLREAISILGRQHATTQYKLLKLTRTRQ